MILIIFLSIIILIIATILLINVLHLSKGPLKTILLIFNILIYIPIIIIPFSVYNDLATYQNFINHKRQQLWLNKTFNYC